MYRRHIDDCTCAYDNDTLALEVGDMTTHHLVKAFNDMPARRMHDRWMKDIRVKSIAPKPVKLVVAKVLADLTTRTDTLAVGRPSRTAKILIEARLLHEADLTEGFFFVLLQRELRRIRGVKSHHTELLPAHEVGYLLFTYKP